MKYGQVPGRRIASVVALLFFLACAEVAQAPLPPSATYELGFSPGRSSLAVVLKAIAAARHELLVACYEFTSRDIAEAVEAAAHRGVKVRIVADWKASNDRYSQIRILAAAGIPIRLDQRYAILHHKFLVIDGISVETGSFNYTASAIERNAENALVLWNVPLLAEAYAKEWLRLWDESKPESLKAAP